VDEWQRLEVFLDSIFADAPPDLPSLSKWAPAVKVLMINGVAWTDAIAEREQIRLEYVGKGKDKESGKKEKEKGKERDANTSFTKVVQE
jgi:hypothetical protein